MTKKEKELVLTELSTIKENISLAMQTVGQIQDANIKLYQDVVEKKSKNQERFLREALDRIMLLEKELA